ncbi:MAG: hypothetical protein H0V18_03735 [Pyrinomonadaceae bacterium]|nr:hypothetical protein [Pyrinomonadaceae bacterium]
MTTPSNFRPETSRKSTSTDDLVIQSFAKLHRTALGIALGLLCGLVVFAATAILLTKGGSHVGPNLVLLGQYFIGYSVTWRGSLVGLLYGFAFGFIVGWSLAFLRNLFLSTFLQVIKLKARLSNIGDLYD